MYTAEIWDKSQMHGPRNLIFIITIWTRSVLAIRNQLKNNRRFGIFTAYSEYCKNDNYDI